MKSEIKKVILQFNKFIETIDNAVQEFINLKDYNLTRHLSNIHIELWKNYKVLNGNSKGFYGISEYIVFSAFKNFIENQNKPLEFTPEQSTDDIFSFKLEKEKEAIIITRSLNLTNLKLGSKRKADIAVLKERDGIHKPIAIIEIKNYLDKKATESALKILKQIDNEVNFNDINYAIFSFQHIAAKDKKDLRSFAQNKNHFVLTNEKDKNKKIVEGIDINDLSEFFDIIKNEVIL